MHLVTHECLLARTPSCHPGLCSCGKIATSSQLDRDAPPERERRIPSLACVRLRIHVCMEEQKEEAGSRGSGNEERRRSLGLRRPPLSTLLRESGGKRETKERGASLPLAGANNSARIRRARINEEKRAHGPGSEDEKPWPFVENPPKNSNRKIAEIATINTFFSLV